MKSSRREFLARAGAAALALPLAARAQTAGRLYKVGVLSDDATPRYQAFREGLRALGYAEGRNLVIEARFDKGNPEGLPALAEDLVKQKVDVIFASSSTYVRAAKRATSAIPIVFAVHNDPVGTGDVASLARPAGRITGLTQMASDLSAKQLQLLKEIVPGLARLAAISNPRTPSHGPVLVQLEAAARTLGMRITRLEAEDMKGLDQAFAAAARERSDAVFVLLSPLTAQHGVKHLAGLATNHRLPTFCAFQAFVDAGGLVAYGPDFQDLYRRAAGYVDKILKGANPADLPVEQPTKFELAINLKTARSLGLAIPPAVLLRADRVVE